jgi:CRP-like cAMP-binding protein
MAQKFRSPEIYKLIQKTGKKATYTKGQIIQSTEGQKTMNFVTKGFVKRYLISNAGNLGVEVIYGVSDFFPVTLMLETFFKLGIYEGSEVYFYEAMNDITVYTVNVDDLAKAAEDDLLLYRDLLRETGRRLHTTLSNLENITMKPPESRVAHQLIHFAALFGEEVKSGIRITIPLTVQDIADILRLDKKDVSKSLKDLHEKHLIRYNKYIIIPDIDRLREEAHS